MVSSVACHRGLIRPGLFGFDPYRYAVGVISQRNSVGFPTRFGKRSSQRGPFSIQVIAHFFGGLLVAAHYQPQLGVSAYADVLRKFHFQFGRRSLRIHGLAAFFHQFFEPGSDCSPKPVSGRVFQSLFGLRGARRKCRVGTESILWVGFSFFAPFFFGFALVLKESAGSGIRTRAARNALTAFHCFFPQGLKVQ